LREDAFNSKVTEKEAQLAGMQPQIEELRRKAHPGSQEFQGQALEIELAFLLRRRLPRDMINPVSPIAPPRASPQARAKEAVVLQRAEMEMADRMRDASA
jgi:hypothetical protein